MNLWDSLLSAMESLRANILRTVLTTLGIIIGVAAVIAMVAVGTGAEQRVQDVIQRLGSNILFVRNGSSMARGARGGADSVISLTEADAQAIEQEIEPVQIAAGRVRGAGQVIAGNTNWFTSLEGVNQKYLEAQNWEIAIGRGFTPAEERAAAKVVVLGQTVATQLFGDRVPLGAIIRVKRVPFTVIGMTRSKGQTPWGQDQDDVIFLPLRAAKKRVLGSNRIQGNYVADIVVKARTIEGTLVAEKKIETLLRQRHRIRPGQPDDFYVRNISQIIEARAESQRTMGFLLAAVAGVSLIVGGIGIMNIMLVSVTERTREIGLRMAVGARRQDVMSQFIIEAVAISIIGGVIGVLLGVGGSALAAFVAGWPMIISPLSVIVALSFSAAVGVFFGYYPALKASRLDPIDALRYE